MKIVVFLIFLITVLTVSGSTNFKQELYLQTDCRIFDLNGNLLKKFNDYLCLFMDDGSYFSLVGSSELATGYITRYSSNGRILWRKKEDVHHELSLTSDKKHITYISSEGGEFNGEKIRFDVLNIADLNGNVIHRYSFKDHFKGFQQILNDNEKHLGHVQVLKSGAFKNYTEYTHFNSFKEIKPNALSEEFQWLKPGNFILGGNCTNLFFIFNRTLTEIIKVINYGEGKLCGTHDAQVLPTGNILHYVNLKDVNNPQSYLEEYDPMKQIVVWSWPKEKNDFYNFMLGSVQRLDNGETIFTDGVAIMKNNLGLRGSKPSVVKISPDGEVNMIWKMTLTNSKELYRARILPLGPFLKNNF